MQPKTKEAISAVNATLSYLESHARRNDVDELRIELKWMLFFLLEGQRTAHGQSVAEFWSSDIEQHAVAALDDCSYTFTAGVRTATGRLAQLRKKLQPFVTCLCP
ncbi:unnamed protein product [Cuscuta epithymum]|uniref:Uncharacterized protein n=1 Tax=Cuscuta epithymum TaxID=186058 RepID=A0AAV0F6H1_9ASTE|nr:unnamed protein product [Cuscuta epithymum]